jgi:hypothetical protein
MLQMAAEAVKGVGPAQICHVTAPGPATHANCGPQSGAICERQSGTSREPDHQQSCHKDDNAHFGAGQDQASRFLEDGLIQDDAKDRGDRRPRQNCLNAAKHVCGAPSDRRALHRHLTGSDRGRAIRGFLRLRPVE